MTMNEISLESLAAALAYAMGIQPPEHAAAANESLTEYVDRCLTGKKADRVFIYNTDGIGQWIFEKYPQFSDPIRACTDLELPMLSTIPPETPIAFGTMYTGAAPAVHGIVKYEKKRIDIDTLFDALARAGKKVALLSRNRYSMSVIFSERNIDYYFYDTWPEVNAKAVELIMQDEYDFILTYNAHYDDVLHMKGPEHPDTLAQMHFNFQTYCMFDRLIQKHWKKHNVLIGTGMDHGCHELENGRGTHKLDIPEDRNIVHFYKIYPKE